MIMENFDDLLSDPPSSEEEYYSDQIDSDIEAELYGLIHHDTPENSVSLQDETVSVENNFVTLEHKTVSVEKNSAHQKIVCDSSKNNSASLQNELSSRECNSVLSKNNINSTKKLKILPKKNRTSSDTVRTSNTDFFSSDEIISNLYTSFETPIKKLKTQNNQVQHKNLNRNTNVNPTRHKSTMVIENENSEINVTGKSTKRKSALVSDILENLQVNRNVNSIQSKNCVSKQNKNSYNCNSVAEEDSFVIVDDSSSDSDSSIISFEPDQSDLQTNLTKDTVVLSSDSEESDSSMEKNLAEVCRNKKTSVASADIGSNKDIWHINSEDLFRTRKQSNRYHETAFITCTTCHLKGHSAKFCSVPKALKCFFCGGVHSGGTCKNKICSKCFRLGHDRRQCYIHYIETCELCRMRGHSDKNCPDLWRRYHLTTSKGSIVKGNPNTRSRLYCYNCGSKGHYGAECIEVNKGRWNLPTWTSVISYTNPLPALRREERKNSERSKPFNNPWLQRKRGNEAISHETPSSKRMKKKKKKKVPSTLPIANHQSTTVVNIQNNYYFPRTPKTNPIPSISNTPRANLKKLKRKQREGDLLRQRELHRIGLQQRLGVQFPSTV